MGLDGSMNLPFTAQEFLEVFGRYNLAVWPAQLVLYAIAIWIVSNALQPVRPRLNLLLLAALWLWAALVYFVGFFTAINPAARLFAVLWIAQAAILVWASMSRPAGARVPVGRFAPLVGRALVGYALVGYPVVGYIAGHRYPETPSFGVPCPTTIFTLGILLWTERRASWLVAIPVLWAVIATVAAVQLSIPQDYGLTVGALLTIAVVASGTALRTHPRPTPNASATRLM